MNTVEWRDDALVLIDQRHLPGDLRIERCESVEAVARAIRELRVRGAPAIGIAAGFGVAIAARDSTAEAVADLFVDLERAAALLKATRPTAVNLAWAVDRVVAAASGCLTIEESRQTTLSVAQRIARDDLASCHAIGSHGAPLIPENARVLTHCNAGALGTAGYGTALGVIRSAHAAGRIREVVVDETRPVLQGARLTAWELLCDGIPVTLITDNAAAHFMQRGRIDVAIVGADRIAANGDVANKIGTYGVAVLARAHDIPFYVAAPLSTIDLSIPDGSHIPIEERSPDEVTTIGGLRIAPDNVRAENPAFDVTPSRLVSGIITDRGVARAPYAESLAALFRESTLSSARQASA
ncbi:MAG: S-methyl-5-thioribose-1-phosphate isomerase [Chloroflexota bacterium]|nr:MAG: S-methyl-5-thioribose-1-phosphate isomerase [Chloroflexota bacterium]